MRPWRRFCCPIDFSDASRTAVQHGAYLVDAFDGELTLVHVYEPPAGGEAVAADGGCERRRQELDRSLAIWARDAEWRTNRAIHSTVLVGSPGEEMARLARGGHFDVFVMNAREMEPGSLMEQIMRQAACPVVVVRMP